MNHPALHSRPALSKCTLSSHSRVLRSAHAVKEKHNKKSKTITACLWTRWVYTELRTHGLKANHTPLDVGIMVIIYCSKKKEKKDSLESSMVFVPENKKDITRK